MEFDRHQRQPRRRSLLLTLTLLVAVLVAAQPLSAAGPQAERKKTKTITRTIANPTAIDIVGQGEASPDPSSIDVSGFRRGKVADVNVRLLGLGHEFPDDIDIMLVAPDGQGSVMMKDAGGDIKIFNVDLTLDDQAPALLPNNEALVSGAFQPVDFDPNDIFPGPAPEPEGVGFSLFTGENPNGTWSLFVTDDAPSDDGTIAKGWELTIRADVVKGGKGKGKGKRR